jgi:nuclear transport factor 2 (NTF2) superfamily protein
VSKFSHAERSLVKSLVGNLSIKRIPEPEIIKEVFNQTNKTITKRYLYYVKKDIKKDSYHWYKAMREGQYEYIHEFKERISEIMDLQKKHHAIIDLPTEPTTVKQVSMAELHRLL